MPIIKCKMCGGDIQLAEDKTFGTCEYCGSTMTFPKVSDEQRAAAFNRGNHFRRIGEFDKALGVYEHIVADDDNDAEAHWCCALCRFGIEYVEDPATYEWLPTCHRASFDSFLEDVDYLAALEHSDGITRRQYQKDAAKIAEVQRGILAASQNTEPYDVFISYKELDENGERTRDSILAQEIYYRLTEKGWRVFFSRISLEAVPGTQYEPYIFAALNSAKVMIVVGTSAENLNAVWVKNEWSRFLAMMRKDRTKLLIPCYRDMDPYDLPEQLSVLMSYDMGKLGFIQDLIRGVDKVLNAEKKEPKKETVVVQGGGANVTALLKRGQQALEDSQWEKAREFFDRVLDADAENAEAFFGLFLAGAKCTDESAYIKQAIARQGRAETLCIAPATERIEAAVKANVVPGYLEADEIRKLFDFDMNYPSTVASQKEVIQQEKTRFETNRNLSRAFRYASKDVSKRLDSFKACLFAGLVRNEEQAKEQTEAARKAKSDAFQEHLAGAEKRVAELKQDAEAARENSYQSACVAQAQADSVSLYQTAIEKFRPLGDYMDCRERIERCQADIDALNEEARQRKEAEERAIADRNEQLRRKKEAEAKARAEEEKRRRIAVDNAEKARRAKKKKLGILAVTAVLLATVGWFTYTKVIIPGNQYKAAEAMLEAGRYEEAIAAFEALGDYRDSAKKIEETNENVNAQHYSEAEILLEAGNQAQAAMAFAEIGDYKDAQERSRSLWDQIARRDTIAVGDDFTVGLKKDGTAISVGSNNSGRRDVAGWTDIIAISAGYGHTVGLKADGTVVAVGVNYDERCNVSDWTDIVAIAAGYYHTIGLRADGTVVAAGSNIFGECNVSDWTNIVGISAGACHTVGIKADGTVVAVGSNEFNKCNIRSWKNVVSISAGYDHTVGLMADGTVVAVGNNNDNQCEVSQWTDIVDVYAGSHCTIGLKKDGSVVMTRISGKESSNYCLRGAKDWKGIMDIAIGYSHVVGIKTDGTIVATGENDDGECNVSVWKNIMFPKNKE